MQGSILDGHVDVLAHRLRGLCDNVMPTTSGNQADANRYEHEYMKNRSIILSFFQHFSLNARPAELNARNSLNSRNFSLTQAKFCQNFVNFSKVKDKPIKHEPITYQQAKQAGKPGGKK